MAKIDVETLKFILQRNEPDVRKVNEIMQEVEMELKAEEEEKANRPPPSKSNSPSSSPTPKTSSRTKTSPVGSCKFPKTMA